MWLEHVHISGLSPPGVEYPHLCRAWTVCGLSELQHPSRTCNGPQCRKASFRENCPTLQWRVLSREVEGEGDWKMFDSVREIGGVHRSALGRTDFVLSRFFFSCFAIVPASGSGPRNRPQATRAHATAPGAVLGKTLPHLRRLVSPLRCSVSHLLGVGMCGKALCRPGRPRLPLFLAGLAPRDRFLQADRPTKHAFSPTLGWCTTTYRIVP